MAEYNIPNPLNYRIDGGVQAFVEKELSAGVYGSHLCLGNIVDAEFTPEVNKYQHYSPLYSLRRKDRVITIQTGGTVKLTLDELVKENLEMAFQTSSKTASQTALPPKIERVTFVAGVAQVNSGAAINDVLWIKHVTSETPYDEGATGDYTVTAGTGTITQTVGTTMSATETVIVCYRISVTANRFSLLSDTDIRGRLHIISFSTDGGGPSMYMYFPMVELKSEDAVGLIALEEPKQFSLNCELVLEGSIYGYLYTW